MRLLDLPGLISLFNGSLATVPSSEVFPVLFRLSKTPVMPRLSVLCSVVPEVATKTTTNDKQPFQTSSTTPSPLPPVLKKVKFSDVELFSVLLMIQPPNVTYPLDHAQLPEKIVYFNTQLTVHHHKKISLAKKSTFATDSALSDLPMLKFTSWKLSYCLTIGKIQNFDFSQSVHFHM